MRLSVRSLALGPTLGGRGAWLCANSANCAVLAAKRRSFDRAFRAPVSDAAIEQFLSVFVRDGVVRENEHRTLSTLSNNEGAG